MKTILIHSISGNDETLFNPNERDGYNDPLIYLREKLDEIGYVLKSSNGSNLENCEWVFFYDEPSVNPYKGWIGFASQIKSKILGRQRTKNLYKECIKSGMKSRIVLFLWEAESIIPLNWDPNLHKLFSTIFTWNDKYIDNKKFFKIHWPQTRIFKEVPKIKFDEKKLLVNISMNKSSTHPRELYSKRLNSIRYFEQNQSENFDLYGVGWEATQFPSYRGTVLNKWDVLPKYRFSLCYENIYDEQGWITEKIFDCFRSNCVPIYWGAPNITDYVDQNTFIDRRNFRNDKELEDYIVNMTEQDYNQILEAIYNYLKSERFSKFLPTKFAETIINTLKL